MYSEERVPWLTPEPVINIQQVRLAKIGGLMGKQELHTNVITSSSDIISKPVVFTRSDGSIWGCG